MPLPQHLPRPLLKRLDDEAGHLRRRRLAERAVHRAREPHLQQQMDLRARVGGVGVGVAFLGGSAGGGVGFVGEFAEGPAGEEGGEDFG